MAVDIASAFLGSARMGQPVVSLPMELNEVGIFLRSFLATPCALLKAADLPRIFEDHCYSGITMGILTRTSHFLTRTSVVPYSYAAQGPGARPGARAVRQRFHRGPDALRGNEVR